MHGAWSLFHRPQSIMFAINKCTDHFSRWTLSRRKPVTVSIYRTRQNSPTSQYVLFNKFSNIEPPPRRCTTARYMRLYLRKTDISPMYNGEVGASVYKKDWYLADVHFADNQPRDIDTYFIPTVSLRRWPRARYWVLHYIDSFTSPMINGEILMPTLYRRFHFADDQGQDIESFVI